MPVHTGAMISQPNLAFNFQESFKVICLTPQHSFISYLGFNWNYPYIMIIILLFLAYENY
ncbi:hypothetical protein A2526_03735 [candidate division WOR-1 bacterium RIFOXYD2_FULL_36_8]|uniref:Uncharacterized protein n=1 Tax=candidate division WOR-1 bacterium RIFOXYB2_FULL_36_35 TaxID=1802578 RepID=A0A1F4RZ82_UNCSA|nr:MAG: hypothetical protein A2290_07175 [candidate division WOR-1 bacterium RIFOXYB2_FULL_36_35]OGC40063.1 MAG: hypothetical protein A2526_03735 [candidate division WOR-1 bacterium RIFOXYD2_FULL_36_8]